MLNEGQKGRDGYLLSRQSMQPYGGARECAIL